MEIFPLPRSTIVLKVSEQRLQQDNLANNLQDQTFASVTNISLSAIQHVSLKAKHHTTELQAAISTTEGEIYEESMKVFYQKTV